MGTTTRICMHRAIDASPAAVWDVLTDHDLYAEAAPNLSTVEVLEGAGEGMVRRCVDTRGNEWTETCTRWDDSEGFAVSVDVETSDFHARLFDRFEGEWRLEERDDDVVVAICFRFDPKYGPLGTLISKFFEYKVPDIVGPIFDAWEETARSREMDTAPSGVTGDARQADRDTNALYR